MAARIQRSRPMLESFGARLEGEAKKVLPKSPVGEAIAYARSNGAALTRYIEALHQSTTTRPRTRSGPLPWDARTGCTSGVIAGGQTAATLLSLVQSCKNLGNEPFAYLRDVLARVSTHPNSRVDDLLPDRRVWAKASPAVGRKG